MKLLLPAALAAILVVFWWDFLAIVSSPPALWLLVGAALLLLGGIDRLGSPYREPTIRDVPGTFALMAGLTAVSVGLQSAWYTITG